MYDDEEIIYVNPDEGFEYMVAAARVRSVRLGIFEIAMSRNDDFNSRLVDAVPDAMRVISEGIAAYTSSDVFGSEASKRHLSAWIIAIFNDAAVVAVDEFHRTLITESN